MTEIIAQEADEATFQAIWSCYLCTVLAGTLSFDETSPSPAVVSKTARSALAKLDATIASGHPPPSIRTETEALGGRVKQILHCLSTPVIRNPRKALKELEERADKLRTLYNEKMAPWLLETGVKRFYEQEPWSENAFANLRARYLALPEEQRRRFHAKLLATAPEPEPKEHAGEMRGQTQWDDDFSLLADSHRSALLLFPPPFQPMLLEDCRESRVWRPATPPSDAEKRTIASMTASFLFDYVMDRRPQAFPKLMGTVFTDILRSKGVRRLNPGSIYALLPDPAAICDAAARERGEGTELFRLLEVSIPAALSYFRQGTSHTHQFVVAAVYARISEALNLLVGQLALYAKGMPAEPSLVLLSDWMPFEGALGRGKWLVRHLGHTFTIDDKLVRAGADIAARIYTPERQSYYISLLSLLIAIRLPILMNTKAAGEYLGIVAMFAHFAKERGDHIVAGRPARDMIQPDGSLLLPYEPQPIDAVMESWGLPLHPDAKVPLPVHTADTETVAGTAAASTEEEWDADAEPWDLDDILNFAEPDEDQIQPDPPQEPAERETLRVSVELAGDADTAAERARNLVLDWIEERTGGELPAAAREGQGFEALHTGQTCLAVRAVGGDADQWAIRAERQDARQAQRTWGVEAIVTVRGGVANLTTRSFVRSARPVFPEPGTPALLQTLAKEGLLISGGVSLDGLPLAASDAAGAEKLLKLLMDPARALPVVVLTQAADQEGPDTDPIALARSTVGAAFVAVLDPAHTSWLAERLGKGLGVSDGLIRIYMPGLARGDEPLRHPIHYSGREDAGPYLASAIRSRLASDSMRRLRPGREIPTFADVRQRSSELLRAQLEAMDAGAPERLEAALREIEELRIKIEEHSNLAELAIDEHERLEERALQAESLNRVANHRITHLEHRLASLEGTNGKKADVPVTWDDFAGWCEEHLAGRVVLSPQARREVAKPEYNNTAVAAKCLEWLATTYRDRKIAGGEGSLRGPLKVEGLEGVKNDWCGTDAWQCDWQDRPLEIRWHLKNMGSTRDPSRCLRIYYGWDEATQQVVIAKMPAHIINDNS